MSCNCKNEESYYVGDDLKLPITITIDGFDQDTDPWTATFVVKNGKPYVCSKRDNTVTSEDGQWYLLLRTKRVGSGLCVLIVDVDIPDSDFEGGYRHEVYKQELFPIKPR